MKLIAKKRCSYGGRKFFAGDEIPADIVLNVEREEKLGVISIANDEAGVPEQSGALYSQEQVDKMMADAVANASKGFTQEQVDEMIQSAVAELKPFDSDNAGFTVTVKGEGDNVTAVSCSAEDIQSVVDVLQMNAGRWCKGSSQRTVRQRSDFASRFRHTRYGQESGSETARHFILR